ncbi:hypothetical protein F4780DRAFT_109386 [Xylariomycetidae sp. FL0641]|nr:hypothetical protein F4780DRAFT_109386 [Xylariomycetidae sp. FL0641]
MAGQPPLLQISPPLLNSANPWATTLEDLRTLYNCSSTGAVTTRTTLLNGFPHDPKVHRHVFFNPATHAASSGAGADTEAPVSRDLNASLNTLGYSPIPLDGYLGFIRTIVSEQGHEEEEEKKKKKKTFIVSVTGTPDEVAECYTKIAESQQDLGGATTLAMEINLSCPNIPGKPPPAYDDQRLEVYLRLVARAAREVRGAEDGRWMEGADRRVPWGIKIPPYTHAGQFQMLAMTLREVHGVEGGTANPLSFVSATNTLGSCLVLPGPGEGEGIGGGGMAGAPLHPLALGNVKAIRAMLDGEETTRHVQVIGIGGVEDAAGYRRMRSVGAAAVGVGTALGRFGVGVFGEIEKGLDGEW